MIKLYGLKVSYFTGKLEGYLRYKEIPFEFRSMSVGDFKRRIPALTGAMQMPAVELPDGRWMTDTTPIIDWFELEYPQFPILPADPAQAFLCRLIEDYADEWLWRPAMHYRWSYPSSAKLLARLIVDEMAGDVAGPALIKRAMTERRQRGNFVKRDGVDAQTRGHVERGYLRLLEILTHIFAERPFIFGGRPTLADIGLFGPMFRHFSMDPAPAAIMRETAPGVMEWVYRLWNARGSRMEEGLVGGVPADLQPLFMEIAQTHLAALGANAIAWRSGRKLYDADIEGAPYRNLQTSQYRVWCLEQLQAAYLALDNAARAAADAALAPSQALGALFAVENPQSNYDEGSNAPFGRSIPVFAQVRR